MALKVTISGVNYIWCEGDYTPVYPCASDVFVSP